MRNKILILLLLVCGVCQARTELPDWMDAERRESLFPQSTYYCGFAVTEMGRNDSVEETLSRLTQNAYGSLMERISVTVQHHAKDSTRDVVGTHDAYSQSVYSSTTTLSTRMTEIPGIEVKTFVDPERRVAAVLAYVKKAGLAQKLQRQLLTQMTRVDVKLEDAESYVKDENKTKARETIAEVRKMMDKAEDTRQTMSAINPALGGEELMETEWREAEKRIIAMEKVLSRTVKILLWCTLNDKEDNTLRRTVSGELYRNGCEIVSEVDSAEWIVEITASVEKYNKHKVDRYTYYFSMATAVLKITDKEGRLAYSDELQCKGSHMKSFDYSNNDALQKMSSKISEIINNTVQK